VTIPHSSAIVAEGTIEWSEDFRFGYDVAAAVPGVDDIEILQPRRLYGRHDRAGEHAALAARLKQERLKQERKDFLGSFPGLDESLDKIAGVAGVRIDRVRAAGNFVY
jgi:ATP-dependent phosphoenolpyruvate carboxykinase